MDLVLDQALDLFGQSSGLLFHLNWEPIKHMGPNLNLNRPDLSINIPTPNVLNEA